MQSYHHYDKVRYGSILEDCKLIISAEKDNFSNVIKSLSFLKKIMLVELNYKKKLCSKYCFCL